MTASLILAAHDTPGVQLTAFIVMVAVFSLGAFFVWRSD
jgi:hypothetical protein